MSDDATSTAPIPSEPVLTPLECLAVVILQQARPGYIIPRWLCLRADLRESALAKARETYERWRDGELDALAARDAAEKRALTPP